MPKAMIALIILFVAVLGYLLFLGGKKMMGGTPPTTAEVKKENPPAGKNGSDAAEKAASQAQALLDKASGKVKRTASEAMDALRGPVIQLSLTETPILVEAGTPKEVKIRRANDAAMDALQLKFFPAAGSKLTARGGTFEKGAAETTFTVEALAPGMDASLTIEADENARIVVPVRVK